MSRRNISLFALAFLITLLFTLPLTSLATLAETPAGPASEAALVQQLQTNSEQLSFKLATGQVNFDNGQVSAEGLNATLREPGAPLLPYYETLIALPPGATASVEIGIIGDEQVQPAGVVEAAPQQQPFDLNADDVTQLPTNIDDLGLVYESDPAIYEQDNAYPAFRYTLSEPAYMRDIRFVALHVYPVRYNPVTEELLISSELNITISFEGAEASSGAINYRNDTYLDGLANEILNFEQAKQWQHVPANFSGTTSTFPTGIDTYKIEVVADGIHELSYSDLQAAGMDVDNIDPATLEMMYRGSPVAYQFIGDADNDFEAGEALRFFGQAFSSTRYEELFEDSNYYWIWAGGTATLVGDAVSASGQPAAANFRHTAILESNDWFSTTSTNDWDSFPNDADSFYYDNVDFFVEDFEKSYDINLPNPDTSGADATVTGEFLSRFRVILGGIEQDHATRITLNAHPNVGSSPTPWKGIRNENASTMIPASALLDGNNSADVTFATNIDNGTSSVSDRLLVNEIRVEYDRLFVAQNDTLQFAHPGQSEFSVSGLSSNSIHIWKVSDGLLPIVVDSSSATITGAGPFTITFGDSSSTDLDYFVTTEAAIVDVTPADLTEYNGPDLDPAGGADWVAITHSSLLTASNNLATHRSSNAFGNLTTHVVDIQDIYNQYGYGFPIPASIQDFLSHAIDPTTGWATAPGYVVLVGDATINPNQYDIVDTNVSWWDPTQESLVVSDLLFIDRFLGMVVSDHTFTTLVGNDLVPDIALGRLAAQDNSEAQAMVDKIILYEMNGQDPTGIDGHREVLFVADDTDDGGDFCAQNLVTAEYLPDTFNDHHLCLDAPSGTLTNQLIQDMKSFVNSPNGISLLNYRGHGSINVWGSPSILSVNNPSFWLNTGRPPVILSLDCLDGHFGYPGLLGLGETILGLDGVGSAGHWSSSGLGFWFEHEVLATELYSGLFGAGLTRLGDAVNYSKTAYWNASQTFGYDESELYSFTLQGDPALHLFRPNVSIDKQVNEPIFDVGDPITFTINISNTGLYPSNLVITDTMPAGVTYLGYTSTITTEQIGPEPVFALSWGANITDTIHGGIPFNGQATIEIYGTAEQAGVFTNHVEVYADGYDLDLSNNSALAQFTTMRDIFLPIITRP